MGPGQYTYHEILSQPYSWAAALDVLELQHSEIEEIWQAGYIQILFTGCGSTYYLALAAAALTQEMTGIPARGVPASELWLHSKIYYPSNGQILLVAVSRSGETTETLRACQAFREGKFGELITLSCYPNMPLAKMGALNLIFPSGQEQSVAQTRAFSTLYLACAGLASTWSGSGLGVFSGLSEAGVRLLAEIDSCIKFYGQDTSLERFYFLGSGTRYGLACEISLKMKEMSLSHSEPFHFHEFRHGPISMVNPETLVIGLLSEAQREIETGVLADVRALGGRILTIGEASTEVQFTSGLTEPARNILYLPVGQLLAYERSLTKGLNPDSPHNLNAVVKLS